MAHRFRCIGLVLVALLAATAARAQDSYPNRPIRLVCGFPAGSSLDVITRIYAGRLEKGLGQPVIVENRAGASGNLAAETVVRAAPDGYTLLTNGVTLPISMRLFKKLPFDVLKDLAPVGIMGNIPIILAVSDSTGVTSVSELIALAKSRPEGLTHGSAGIGSIQHLAGELFNSRAGVKLAHVPYRGTNQVIVDFLGGRLSAMFAPAPTLAPVMKDGKFKMLGVTSPRRSTLYPDLPTLSESGLPNFDAQLWFGIWAPKDTPRPIIATLHKVMDQVPNSAEGRAQLAASAIEAVSNTTDEFAAFVRQEVDKWAKLVDISGASAE
ncbi:MAG: tripartite tricarboxylate transporter substrate binding protein [Hyphomicrobiales bacterium]|nr:tripartite tricarboxylate transporter substrate binding protein [Hyphomicrobiales bacterium]